MTHALLSTFHLLLLVSLPDLRQEVIFKERVHAVIRLPAPFAAGQRVVHIFGPRVDNALPPRVRLERNLRAGEGFNGAVAELARR